MTLIVLMSVPEPKPTTNPYITLLSRSLRESGAARVEFFSWRRALIGRYDVFHSHWPENLLRARGRFTKLVKLLLFLGFLASLSLRRKPVVQTVHNLKPHENVGAVDRFLLRGLEKRVTMHLLLNRDIDAALPDRSESVTIPHGDYREWYGGQQRRARIPGKVAFVGLIKPYKGLGVLIDQFNRLDDADSLLQISGKPSTPELAQDLMAAAEGKRVSLDLSFQTDAQLVEVVTSAVLVALPYTEMYNSGAALLALSLDRPILVPDNAVTAALAQEVGEQWVIRYSPPLSATDLARALKEASHLTDADGADLSARTWRAAGKDHVRAYERAISLRNNR